MNVLLLDTSTPMCQMAVNCNGTLFEASWDAGRELSLKIFTKLEGFLKQYNLTYQDITAIGVFRGPGSYTGLRIGITVANSLADSLEIPIVGHIGIDWMKNALSDLKAGKSDRIVLPEYGSLPHITTARK